jgi:hypothetical protein
VRDQRSVCRPTRPNRFDVILDRVTGSDPSVTDYVFEQLAKCPNCRYANEKLKGCAENFNAFRLRSSVKKLPETRINTDAPAKSTSLNLPDHGAEPR